jgi:hypothetical protein
VGHGTHTYICVYISAVGNRAMLQKYVRRDFYNIIFKVKPIIYSLRVSTSPPPPSENLWVRSCDVVTVFIISPTYDEKHLTD